MSTPGVNNLVRPPRVAGIPVSGRTVDTGGRCRPRVARTRAIRSDGARVRTPSASSHRGGHGPRKGGTMRLLLLPGVALLLGASTALAASAEPVRPERY